MYSFRVSNAERIVEPQVPVWRKNSDKIVLYEMILNTTKRGNVWNAMPCRCSNTNVPDEPAVSICDGKAIYTYDGGSKFLRNVYIGLSKYTASQFRLCSVSVQGLT